MPQQLWAQAVQLDGARTPRRARAWRRRLRAAPTDQHQTRSKATIAGQHAKVGKHARCKAAQPLAETIALGGVVARETDGARQRHAELDRLLDHPVERVTAEQHVRLEAIGDEAQPAAVDLPLTPDGRDGGEVLTGRAVAQLRGEAQPPAT